MFRLHRLTAFPFPSFVFLPLLAALVAAQAGNDTSWVPFNRTQFDGNTALDTKGDVQLFWKIGDVYSTYGIASRSNGYLALGFSETGAMTGADIALGYKNSSGEFVLENRHATGFVTPEISDDQVNNIRFVEGDQENGVTGFVFEKKNKADCLDDQVDVSTDSWQWFIYAFSDDNAFAQHGPGDYGKQYVKLGTFETVSVNDVEDVPDSNEFTVISPEITVPSVETTYCYSLHQMPAGKKNFILGEQPSSSGNLLHHLVIYACYDLPDVTKLMLNQTPNCDANFSNPCTGFVTEWAPGMSGRTFKSGFGKPFGSDSYEYVMLETHYNNPNKLEGEKDSSGYTFKYNDKPVENEIGTLALGAYQVDGWFLDPGKELVSKTTVCTPDCTKKWPSDGITAVSVFFHMHLRGRNERVQIIRDGKEIPELSSIRSFEYGFQYLKTLPDVKLLPGDRLITTCEYNTTNDTSPVPGGYASKDEMCFAWVDYYPANDVLVCTDVDMGYSPDSPMNGTVGFCLQTNGQIGSSIFPSDSINATYQPLPASGNNCTTPATGGKSPSGTGSAASTTKTSSASSALSSHYWTLFAIASPIALTTIFALQFL